MYHNKNILKFLEIKMLKGDESMNVKILSDSACDLPKEIIEKYDIDILPIVVLNDEEEFLDKVNISPEKIYKDMRNGEIYKTAQISPNVFREKFNEYAKEGKRVIYLAFSSELSGTYQNSTFVRDSILEKHPDFDLDIIDTKAASLGFGLIVLEIAKLAKEGKSKAELLKRTEFYNENIEHIFTVDNIEYLFKGGRISRSQAVVGGLLNIKPILNIEDGKLVAIEKIRGKNKVYKTMLSIMGDRLVDRQDQTIGIAHGDNLEGANRLKEMIEEEFGFTTFIINSIGCAIGVHVGPGALVLVFFKEKYKG